MVRRRHAVLGRQDGRVALLLDARGDLPDRLRGAHRPLGELADLARHDREASAGVSRPGRLDRRVQGQQVRLLGDAVDELEDLADLLASLTCFECLGSRRLSVLGDRGGTRAHLLDGRRHL